MPTKKEGSTSAGFMSGRIRDVHPEKWTVDVSLSDGGYIESIPVAAPYLHYQEGEGIYAMPEVDAPCIIFTGSGGSGPCVMCFTPLRRTDLGEESVPEDNHSVGRDTATPGDIFLHGRDGNFVRVRRAGFVEVGASDFCQSIYFPVGDLIRTICMNHETFVGGSYFKTNVIDDPSVPDEGPTPVQVDIMIQEYAEKAPLMDIKLGHVVDDEGRHLAGADAGQIVGRLLVFSQQTVDDAEQAGLDPSPDQAVLSMRFDRNGNAEQIMSGQYLLKMGSRRLFITGSDVQLVDGNRSERVHGNKDTNVGGDHAEHAKGSRTISSDGPLYLSGERIVFSQRRSREDQLEGSQNTVVGGSRNDEIAGDNRVVAGGGSANTCAGNRSTVTGGKHFTTVVHGAEPGSVLQGAIASLLQVVDGTIRQHAMAGDIEVMVGPSAAPYCRVRLHAAPNRPNEFGRVSIEWLNPRQHLIIDGLTGHIEYKNSVGEWVMDPSGRTKIGLQDQPAGNVVTTLTHPICYVTGAPILGCAAVAAAGPPVPTQVAAPTTPVVENAPNPDTPRP